MCITGRMTPRGSGLCRNGCEDLEDGQHVCIDFRDSQTGRPFVQAGQQRGDFLVETPALVGQLHRAGGAVEQTHAQPRFQGEGGYDAGFRRQESLPADMVAIPFSRTIRSIVVGSPAYFEGREIPRVPHDLLKHDCIRMRMASGAIWPFFAPDQ